MYQSVELDETVIKAVRQGFDLEAFVDRVKNDSTYYKAFKTLRLLSHTTYTDMDFFNSKESTIAQYNAVTKQLYSAKCRQMKFISQSAKGQFYKRSKEYRFLTARLYDKLFFTHGKVCGEDNIVGGVISKSNEGKINQLKSLIFNPGQSVSGVPGIGNKMAIFDDKERQKYKFTLRYRPLNDTFCYVFKAVPKAEYKNKVVINSLETWFRLPDYSIMARKYSLSYKTMAYDFDVEMEVKLTESVKGLVPYEVLYKGDWHLLGKRREIANFTATITDFR